MDSAETLDIGIVQPDGYANAAAQDSFCLNTTCIINKIYDQSPRHNDLTIEGAGGAGSADVGWRACERQRCPLRRGLTRQLVHVAWVKRLTDSRAQHLKDR